MTTTYLSAEELARLLDALRTGGVVACPTETQIGLLADVWNEPAVERVCEMKRRPVGEAIALIAPSLESALRVARDVSPKALQVARRYWPGPLTLVLRGDPRLPMQLRKNGTVAVRVPGPSPALELVKAFGAPLTASSANLSGQRPLTNAAELRAVFGDALSVIASGVSPGGLPSTIVDLTGDEARVLRQGSIVLPPRLELES